MDFSIIIPTYNRPAQLERCLDSLAQLNYPASAVEVIVVDDGSTVSYEKVRSKHPETRWLRVENGGPANARNRGADIAKGRWLGFTDDDCQPDTEWLNTFREVFELDQNVLLGGSTPALPNSSTYDQVSQFVTYLVYLHYNRDAKDSSFFASNNIAVSRELFVKVGGFDCTHTKNAAEDRTFCNVVKSSGYPLKWIEEAIVYHHPQLTLSRYTKMYFRYGRGAYTYHRSRRAGRMREDLHFHRDLLKLILRGWKKHPDLPLIPTIGLIGVWQVANLAGFLWQSLRGTRF